MLAKADTIILDVAFALTDLGCVWNEQADKLRQRIAQLEAELARFTSRDSVYTSINGTTFLCVAPSKDDLPRVTR